MAQRSAPADISSIVRRAVGAAERPLSAAAVFAARGKLGLKATRPSIEAALDELAASGDVQRHPPARTGGASLFHRVAAVDYAANRLAAVLSGDVRLTERFLRKSVGKSYEAYFDEALAGLIAAGRLRPTRFLTARHVTALRSIAETLNTLRRSPLDMPSLLAFLDGAASVSAASRVDGMSTGMPAPGQATAGTAQSEPPKDHRQRSPRDRHNHSRSDCLPLQPQAPVSADGDLLMSAHGLHHATVDVTPAERPVEAAERGSGEATAFIAPEELAVDLSLTEEQLVRWYADDVSQLGGLRSVPIPGTFRRYEDWCRSRACQPNADLFRSYLLQMAERTAIGLTPHDHDGRLSAGEAAVLPVTPSGYRAYYWTVLA